MGNGESIALKKVKARLPVDFLDQTERGDSGHKHHQPQALFPPLLESSIKCQEEEKI